MIDLVSVTLSDNLFATNQFAISTSSRLAVDILVYQDSCQTEIY